MIVNVDFFVSELYLKFFGVSLFLEFLILIVLCFVFKFIEKLIVKVWICRIVDSEYWMVFLYYFYVLILWMYFLWNLVLVFYDMVVFVKKID